MGYSEGLFKGANVRNKLPERNVLTKKGTYTSIGIKNNLIRHKNCKHQQII